MLSFPSSFSKGSTGIVQEGKSKYTNLSSTQVNSSKENAFSNVQAKNLKLTESLKKYIYNTDSKFTTFDGYIASKYLIKSNNDGVSNKQRPMYYEDPLKNDIRALRSVNMYQFVYKNPVYQVMNIWGKQNTAQDTTGKSGGPSELSVQVTTTAGSPALFNPSMAVNAIGITENVPLLNSVRSGKQYHISEPTIENLIKGSKKDTGILGNARYRLIDFIYCKDLGKVSNNHLITLRKFANPIGDHIYKWSTKRGHADISMETTQDVGRLISWFDTDDNKLEDICSYEMSMSWKEIQNDIEAVESKENNDARGPLGMIFNSMNPQYNTWQGGNFGGPGNNLMSTLASKYLPYLHLTEHQNDNMDVLQKIRIGGDDHRVYKPKNTIQDTHLYEGKLTLNQEITLTFSYKLRAYDNINPKSAMLDLLGNVYEVTYQRGSYWKGENRFIGPPQNKQSWQKANNIIDHAWKELGGFISALADGTDSFTNIMGNISQKLSDEYNTIKNKIKEAGQAVGEAIQNASEGNIGDLVDKGVGAAAEGLQTLNNVTNISGAFKGLMNNTLGRPAMYAMTSLIDGGNCGFWHLTIGNPFNPIMSIGNLILTSSKVTHSGPLGVDDFPTDLKITVTLKPGRSRDATEVSRYYTKGLSAIYMPKNLRVASDYHKFSGFSNDGEDYFKQLDKDSMDKVKAVDSQDLKTTDELLNASNIKLPSDNMINQYYANAASIGDDGLYSNTTYYNDKSEGTIAMTGTLNPLHYIRSMDQLGGNSIAGG